MLGAEQFICAQASTNDPNDSHAMFTAVAQGQRITKINASRKNSLVKTFEEQKRIAQRVKKIKREKI